MGLREFVDAHRAAEGEAAEQIRLLIDYDGRSVRELSTDRQLEVRTLTLLLRNSCCTEERSISPVP